MSYLIGLQDAQRIMEVAPAMYSDMSPEAVRTMINDRIRPHLTKIRDDAFWEGYIDGIIHLEKNKELIPRKYVSEFDCDFTQ